MDEKKITCDKCAYGRHIGGNDWGCVSERRRMDRLKLVNNVVKEDFNCEHAKKSEFLL